MNNLAPIKLRVLAALLDWSIGVGLGLSSLLIVTSVTKIESLFGAVLWAIVWLLCISLFSIPALIIFPITKLGGTIGQYLTGLEIVDEKENWVDWKTSLLRNYLGHMVSGLLLGTGYFWALRDTNRQTWHDMIAGTFVIQKRAWATVGILACIVLAAIHFMIVRTALQQISNNRFMYVQLFRQFEQVSKELDTEEKVKNAENNMLIPTPTAYPLFPTPAGKSI